MTDTEPVATASQTVGPFFHFGLTAAPNGRLVDRLQDGQPVTLVIRVLDGDGLAVGDAAVEIMQGGVFGRMPTGDDGTCAFDIVRPRHASNGDRVDAPHVHVCLFARGLLRHLHTRIYFADDAALGTDPVLALVPEHRRTTLLARPDPAGNHRWSFVIRLQGAGETVFFDG